MNSILRDGSMTRPFVILSDWSEAEGVEGSAPPSLLGRECILRLASLAQNDMSVCFPLGRVRDVAPYGGFT